ncbi:MAG: hypothetical protein ACLUQ6_10120, partial [Alistipes onderdonkii]
MHGHQSALRRSGHLASIATAGKRTHTSTCGNSEHPETIDCCSCTDRPDDGRTMPRSPPSPTCWRKSTSTFLPCSPNTDPADFKPVFITRRSAICAMLHDRLSGEVKSLAGSYLTELKVQDVTYDIGKIDIGGDVVDMLCENLDSEGTPNPKNTLHLY